MLGKNNRNFMYNKQNAKFTLEILSIYNAKIIFRYVYYIYYITHNVLRELIRCQHSSQEFHLFQLSVKSLSFASANNNEC